MALEDEFECDGSIEEEIKFEEEPDGIVNSGLDQNMEFIVPEEIIQNEDKSVTKQI